MKYFLPLGLFWLLLGVSCRPEYLKPVLPGRAPLATTQGYENPAIVDRAIQLKGKVYDGEEELLESGFLVGSSPTVDLTVPGVLRIRADLQMDSAISTAEYQMCADYSLGSVAGTTKYYRAYGRNLVGTGYGEPLNFTSIGYPTVSTNSPSAITSVGAVVGGDISSDGGAPVTARGIAYGLTSLPTTSNSTTINGTGSGSFSATITSLAPSTRYFARAYAQNLVGTSYGSVVDFTTLNPPVLATVNTTAISNITGTAATTGGNVTSDGGAPVSVRGIAYGTTVNPTTSNNATIDGSGTGVFSSSLTSLTPATTYYVRAYATNSVGTAYGNSTSFSSLAPPTVTTSAVSSITSSGALSGGDVLASGGAIVTARGVAYGTMNNPTTQNNSTVDGSGTGSFLSTLAGLTALTNYKVRAYATNSVGTSYGMQESFTTLGLPTISTNSVSSIASTAATSGGNVSSDGGSTVTARGIVYNNLQNPTTSDNFTNNGTGTGSFISVVNGLSASTLYYIRAYATNSVGTAYGNQLSFTTTAPTIATVTTLGATMITASTASLEGEVLSDGGSAVTAKGMAYSAINANPTISNSTTNNGSGTGYFLSSLSGLNATTSYYVRAYATNNLGTAYGNTVNFTTYGLPTVSTTNVTNVFSTSANTGGNVTSSGGLGVNARGIAYGTSTNPTIANNTTNDGSGTGSFLTFLSGLNASTLYYARAYASNSLGTSYGNQVSFTTSAPTLATVNTNSVTSIGTNGAVVEGNVVSNGGVAVTMRGVAYGTMNNPTTSNSVVTAGGGTGVFSVSLSGLTNLTAYNVRAYAINSAGTVYGNQINFSTVSLPTVTTMAVSGVLSTQATSGGNVTSSGGGSVTARGVAYGTSQNPTTFGLTTVNGSGTGVFTSSIAGLSPTTLYYVRAYATTSAGTAYGSQVSFTTSAVPFICGTNTVSDVDGNIYNSVQIGAQCWTQSNLKVSKYRNGNNIPTGLNNSAWIGTTSGAYAIYDNDPVNDGLYGKLYNHYAVTDSRGLCPTGWHVPSDAEWTTLENQLGGPSVAGGALKSTATQPTSGGWISPNFGATNSSGFTALGGGVRDTNGGFIYVTDRGHWWSSSVSSGANAWMRYLRCFQQSFHLTQESRVYGFSVRCIKD